MLHLQVVQVVTFIVAFTLAATRILSATRPFWGKLPAWLAGILPSLVIAIPALGQAVAGAQTWTDLTVAFLTAGALLLPGSPPHSVAGGSGTGAAGVGAVMIGLLGVSSLSGCALFESKLPDLAKCVPTPAGLASQVAAILIAGGDYVHAFELLTEQDGETAVLCAIHAFLGSHGAQGAEPGHSNAAARARAYLLLKGES